MDITGILQCLHKRPNLALIEGGVKEQKIVDLLTKYWNLRPSEAKWYYEEMKNK